MTSIINYRKYIDTIRTIELRLPNASTGDQRCTELATIAGVTYVSLPDNLALPSDQPSEIAASISTAPPDAVTLAAIRAASPHCALISAQIIEKIRASYSVDDEMYFARIGVGSSMGMYTPSAHELQEMTVFSEFVESVRQWGRAQRSALGL